jgi:hypothetical protein
MIGRGEAIPVESISNFWLLKSEPDEFSIDDLAKSPDSTGFWDVSRHVTGCLHVIKSH